MHRHRNKRRRSAPGEKDATLISPAFLKKVPLSLPDEGGDKEKRGRILVVGGCPETPGAVILSALGALRAGAGKLQIVAGKRIASGLAMKIPEALVMAVPEDKEGVFGSGALAKIAERSEDVDAILIGPGLAGGQRLGRFVRKLLPEIPKAKIILDAEALKCFSKDHRWLSRFASRMIITPHAGEMADILHLPKNRIEKDPLYFARTFSRDSGVHTVMKGAETFITDVHGAAYRNTRGNIGLATSGSGDTLAGVIAGIAARGNALSEAGIWGVYLHALAGEELAKRYGPLGYLAREIVDEIPALMNRFSK